MLVKLFKSKADSTAYICLDSRKCEACWKCIPECKNNVLGKVTIFKHKHVVIINPNKCTGCLKCYNICDLKAYAKQNFSKEIL